MGAPIPRTAGAAEEVDKLAAALTEGQEEAAALIDRVLGDAVHPKAVERLVELWPDAYVQVSHAPAGMVPRFTVVKVWPSKEDHDKGLATSVGCSATCHPSDQYDRKAGIAIAFKRALLKVKEVSEGARPL